MVGVDSFFILSGFLITTLLLDEWQRTGTIKLSHFYARRALRLLPALLVLLAVAAVYLRWFATPIEIKVNRDGMFGAFFYGANIMLTRGTEIAAFTHTWSLSLEEQFYVLWPPLVVLALKRHWSRQWLVAVCLGGIVASLVWRAVLWTHYHVSIGRLLYAPDTRFDSLLVGCLVGLLWYWRSVPDTPRARRWGWCASVGALLFLIWIYLRTDTLDPYLYGQGGFTWVALGYAFLLWGLLEYPLKPVRAVLENRFIVWCGKTSYSLYLWHVPVIYVFKMKVKTWGSAPTILLAWLLTFVIAGLSYYLIERPCLRLKRYFSPSSTPSPTPPSPTPVEAVTA